VKLSLAEKVEFLGYRNDVTSILESSHAMILSSSYEGTPNAVLEAMAVGRPIVATNVGDIGDLITHGQEGFVVPVGDVERLAHALGRLALDRDLAAMMGRAARRRVEELPTPDQLVSATLDVYKKVGWKE
jgi:glycosyltransferase involved in cell wall biosynthesis